jgi:hypothetical protein
MNYLVTHYKNLAEQLQSRINHIQQCLYEMDATAAGGGLDQVRVDNSVNTTQEYVNPNNYSMNANTVNYPSGQNPTGRDKKDHKLAPWNRGNPVPNYVYSFNGNQFVYHNGTWYVMNNGTWVNAFEIPFK